MSSVPATQPPPSASPVAADETVHTLRVVVTRPAPQAEKLAQAVEQAGYQAIRFPLLEISPVADPAPLYQALDQLRRYALVVFVSPNAIGQTLRHMMQRGQRWPTEVPIAVLGPGSAESLAEHGIAPPQFRVIQPGAHAHTEYSPSSPSYDSEALLAELARQGFDAAGLAGKPVLLIRGNGGRELLGEKIRAAGAELTVVEAYQRHLSRPTPQAWQAVRSSLGQPHVWLLTSSEAVRNLALLSQTHLTPAEQKQLLAATVITSHPRIAETAQTYGFTQLRLSGAGDSQLLKAVRTWGKAQQGVGEASTDASADPGSWLQVIRSRALWPLAILASVWVLGGIGVSVYKYIANAQRTTQAAVVAVGAQNYAALQDQIKALEVRLQETQVQQSQFAQQVQALNPEQASSRERWTLMEAEQMLSATAQQLQLTGNVGQALVALQTIDTRLALANQAQWIPLRRALAKDIDRLKALPQLDITGAAIKLDEAIALVDTMPMWVDGNPTHAASAASAAVPNKPKAKPPQVASAALPNAGSLWQRWLDMALREARQLVQIRRVDDAQVLLVTPEQAWFLRESLKLRLLNARLALLSRQEATFKSEVTQLQTLVKKHFDPQAPATQTVQTLLQQVQQAAGAMLLPNLSESLAAVRAQAR